MFTFLLIAIVHFRGKQLSILDIICVGILEMFIFGVLV